AVLDGAHQQDQAGEPVPAPRAAEPDQDDARAQRAPATPAGAEATARPRAELCQRPQNAAGGPPEESVQASGAGTGGGGGGRPSFFQPRGREQSLTATNLN
ncbi:hypothetical protein EGW08_015671, partial [Elysia chlorotica]